VIHLRARFLWFALAVCALSLGCAAKASLHASPNVVCAGRTVRLSWDGSREGEITADPPDAGIGDVAATGSKTVRPKVTTTWRFRVSTLLGHATSEASVKVLSAPEKPEKIGASVADEDANAGCSPHALWVTANVPPDAWDSRLRVNTVASGDGREYLVKHSATSARIESGAPSDSFRDQPIAGAWRLESPLRRGEACNTPSLPRSLAIDVTFVCAE
jgi:hypothetical protein